MAGRNLPGLKYHGRGRAQIPCFELDTSSAIRGGGGFNARWLRSGTRQSGVAGRAKQALRREN
jgi:hypothetical protein